MCLNRNLLFKINGKNDFFDFAEGLALSVEAQGLVKRLVCLWQCTCK